MPAGARGWQRTADTFARSIADGRELRKSGKMDGEKELELEQEQERKDICTLTKLFLFASKV